ncbi:sporulation protein Cse60 [Mesobacillus foraminis]|uniref:sporulation protein Cse60 n=1 Tax=Mesobacillus foraminis TaxID=279826 RepID=UPI0039A2697A
MIQVKLFDHEHEKDLEAEMNRFLKVLDEDKLVDIKYNVAAIQEEEEEDQEQIYCFSAMVVYRA